MAPSDSVPIASRACADHVVDMIFFGKACGFEMGKIKDSQNTAGGDEGGQNGTSAVKVGGERC